MKKLFILGALFISINCYAWSGDQGVITEIKYIEDPSIPRQMVDGAIGLQAGLQMPGGGVGKSLGGMAVEIILGGVFKKTEPIYLLKVLDDDGGEYVGYIRIGDFDIWTLKGPQPRADVGSRVEYAVYTTGDGSVDEIKVRVSDKPMPTNASPKAIAALGKKAPIIVIKAPKGDQTEATKEKSSEPTVESVEK